MKGRLLKNPIHMQTTGSKPVGIWRKRIGLMR
jgi:hypothetical protein